MTLRLGISLLGVFLLLLPAWASWEPLVSVAAGTVLGYVGGHLGAATGAALAQAAGVGLVDGFLGPVVFAYVGYAAGSTLGAWIGVTWTGFQLGLSPDPQWAFLGASLGTGLAFFLASFTDWEWALLLSPPLASLGAALFGFWEAR